MHKVACYLRRAGCTVTAAHACLISKQALHRQRAFNRIGRAVYRQRCGRLHLHRFHARQLKSARSMVIFRPRTIGKPDHGLIRMLEIFVQVQLTKHGLLTHPARLAQFGFFILPDSAFFAILIVPYSSSLHRFL